MKKFTRLLTTSVALCALTGAYATAQTTPPATPVAEGATATMNTAGGRVEVEQKKPTVTVTQDDPDVTVNQARPEVTVEQPQPEITVKQAKPVVNVKQIAPVITVEQSQPVVTVRIPQPIVTVRMPKPDVDVDLSKPQVQVSQPDPIIRFVRPEPRIVFEGAEAEVNIEDTQANVNIAGSGQEAKVDINQAEAKVKFVNQDTKAQVNVDQQKARVTVEQTKDADVNVMQEEAVVRVRKMNEERAQERLVIATDKEAREDEDNNGGAYLLKLKRNPLYRMRVSDLIGKEVFGESGTEIGNLEDVALSGNKVVGIVAVGGFLGLGEHEVALPLERMKFVGDNVVLPTLSKAELERMPEYNYRDVRSLPKRRTIEESYNRR